MGICKYCGKNAGFLKSIHPECQIKAQTQAAIKEIEALAQNTIKEIRSIGVNTNTNNADDLNTENEIKNNIALNPNLPDIYVENCKIHEDIRHLLWFGDGKYKNITREEMSSEGECYEIGGYKIRIMYHGGLDIEPSLILMNMPIRQPVDELLVPRPPYYPQYVRLTPEQRWIYLKLLTNPYNDKIDIGYVFIFYYGLERHLLHGDFDSAFNVILKLRDVHKNKSFQSYSGNALILSALWKGKGEYIPLFINSLDKEYEYNFNENLLLMCYFSFDVPFSAKDIMRMAKTFLFNNTNYIKNNPAVFENCLKDTIKEKSGLEYVNLKNYFTDDVVSKLKRFESTIYANTSLIDQEISVPVLITNIKFKAEMMMYLKLAHEKTKKELADMRKNAKIKKIE